MITGGGGGGGGVKLILNIFSLFRQGEESMFLLPRCFQHVAFLNIASPEYEETVPNICFYIYYKLVNTSITVTNKRIYCLILLHLTIHIHIYI